MDVDNPKDLKDDSKPDAKVVVINNLTRNVVDSHLLTIFGFYGEIVKIDVPLFGKSGQNRGKAALEYADSASAHRAFEHMDGGQLDGSILKLELSDLPVRTRSRSRSPPPHHTQRSRRGPPPPPHHSGGRFRNGHRGGGARSYSRSRSRSRSPFSRSLSRSRSPMSMSRSRSPRSLSRSRSRSRPPPPRRRGTGDYGGRGKDSYRGGRGGGGWGRRGLPPVTGISAIVVPDLVPHPHVAVVVVVVAVTPLVVDHRATLAVDTAALRGTTIVEIEIDLTDLRIEVEEAEEEVVVEVVVHEDDRSRVHSPHVPGLLVLDPQGAVRRVILFALVALGQGP
ncbi:hypothetical protein D9756_000842 [Leucocoprinus leucothites]|uniref:RRM domain-containing protein n=1 Tax=Leucocoprinus leucothites TaxID=201217 RepID=A0A8H5GFG6_9AGAR|nr:hypothetical protein D9756_000842 [Leucoagaricus leucothites]